jgi:hypothetical protein
MPLLDATQYMGVPVPGHRAKAIITPSPKSAGDSIGYQRLAVSLPKATAPTKFSSQSHCVAV